MTSLSKQHRVAFVNEASTRFETLYIDDDIMSSVVVVVAAAARKKLFFFLDSFSFLTFIYEDSKETYENVNRRKSTRQSLMKIKSNKTLNIHQDILINRVNYLYIENLSLQYRLEFFKKIVKYELITKSDIDKLQSDNSTFQNDLQNVLAKIMTRFDKIDDFKKSIASKASSLVDVLNDIAKIAKKISKKAFLNIDFAS